MKKLLLGIIIVISGVAMAKTAKVNGYTWTYSEVTLPNEVGGATGVSVDSVSPQTGDLAIPSSLGGSPVVQIGNEMCCWSGITSVEIPEGVRIIGTTAFYHCLNLRRVSLPNSLKRMYKQAFDKSPVADATVPGGSFEIWDTNEPLGTRPTCELFTGTPSVTNLAIAEGSSTIKAELFRDWTGVQTVTIPSSVLEIERDAFKNCCNLKTVYFSGDAPKCPLPIFDLACNDLVVYVPTGSKGWDGDSGSTTLPKLWPHNNSAGRPILHVGEQPSAPESYSSNGTNYVFTIVTNVHVHYVNENEKPTFIFPSNCDTGFVNVIAEVEGGFASIPESWAENYPGFTEKYGNDFAKALSTASGKRDGHGNPMYVWQDYVAGTNPLLATNVFAATIAIEDGQVVVSHSPELDADRAALRTYTVYGKKSLLDAEWKEVSPGSELDYNFFRVTVRMKTSDTVNP